MPASNPAGSLYDQRQWDTSVTLFTESETILPRLYSTRDDALIHVEATEKADDGDARGSAVEFKYGDRRRGQELQPRAIGSQGFGQSDPARPIWRQNMSIVGQQLASTGMVNLIIDQAYTMIPLERHELRACGAEAAELLVRQMYYQLCGITSYNSTWSIPPGGNLVRELDSAHRFFAGAANTSDAQVAIDTAALLTVERFESIITGLQSRASGVISPMAPGWTPWGNWFVAVIDPEGNEQMTRHSSSNRYTSLTLAEIQGGNAVDKVASYMKANSGFQGTRNILYLVDDWLPFGCSGTTSDATTAGTQIGNVRRALILGQLGAHVKWGQGFDTESVHIRATYHKEHTQEEWRFMTHMGMVPTRPENHPTPQRMASATLAYYVSAATPLW